MSPIIGVVPIPMPKVQPLSPSGKTSSWLKGTLIVMPLNARLMVSALEPAVQGIYAELGSLGLGVAPTNAQIEVARACGKYVKVVPESIITLSGVAPATRLTEFPLASVPVTPSKVMVKSTTPSKPSNLEGTRSIVIRLPENLLVSIPPNTNVPDADRSSLVHKLKVLEAI